MKLDVEAIIDIILIDNKNILFGHEYFIDKNEHSLFGLTGKYKEQECFSNILFFPNVTGFEITDDRIMFYENDDVLLILNEKGYKYPDDTYLGKCVNDLKVMIIENNWWKQYKEDREKTPEQILAEVKEINAETRRILGLI